MEARTLSVLGVIISISLVLVMPIRAVYQASQSPQTGSDAGLIHAGSPDGEKLIPAVQAANAASDRTGPGFTGTAKSSAGGATLRIYGGSDDGPSWGPHLSADGRYVAFGSGASNLIGGDTNGYADIFVHDQETGETTRVSVASDGSQGNDPSAVSSISADGRYVAFGSYASDLIGGDANGYADIFVHDRENGETNRVSVASDGSEGNDLSAVSSISADGRYVAFESSASNLVSGDTNGYIDVFVHERWRGITRVSVASGGGQASGHSWDPSISADGRYVAFRSHASNLVDGDTNGYSDIFVHDRWTGETTRVSVASDGGQANGGARACSISADGRYVAFGSQASNLVDGDTNGYIDVFVHDRQTGETTRVSIPSDGG